MRQRFAGVIASSTPVFDVRAVNPQTQTGRINVTEGYQASEDLPRAVVDCIAGQAQIQQMTENYYTSGNSC